MLFNQYIIVAYNSNCDDKQFICLNVLAYENADGNLLLRRFSALSRKYFG